MPLLRSPTSHQKPAHRFAESAALATAEGGETVIICRRNKPIAELKAIAPRQFKERPVGLAAKEYPDWEISKEFFEPLPDDILAAFNGEEE